MDPYLYKLKSVPIFNIQYGHVPTNVASPKVVYVTTRFPSDIPVGSAVRLVATDKRYAFPKSTYVVRDVEGTRISLESPNLFDRNSLGERHASNCYPAWGYVTSNPDAPPFYYTTWMYGNGPPVGYLVYQEKY